MKGRTRHRRTRSRRTRKFRNMKRRYSGGYDPVDDDDPNDLGEDYEFKKRQDKMNEYVADRKKLEGERKNILTHININVPIPTYKRNRLNDINNRLNALEIEINELGKTFSTSTS